ncbi:MAG: hypothetical protein ABIV28_06915 [Longimicrobiales bacterium]
MSLNWKILTLAAVTAGTALAGSTLPVAAQGNPGKGADKHPAKAVAKGVAHKDDHAKATHKAVAQKPVVRKTVGQNNKVVQRTRDEILRDERRDRANGITYVKPKNGPGPSFCRSGAGHPVHGRSWCIDKGFGIGTDRWGRAGWEDVVLGRASSRTGNVSGGGLADILGRVIYGRLVTQSSSFGSAPLTGRWIQSSSGPLVLQVQSGSQPFAEFVDANRDGRADVVYVNLGR